MFIIILKTNLNFTYINIKSFLNIHEICVKFFYIIQICFASKKYMNKKFDDNNIHLLYVESFDNKIVKNVLYKSHIINGYV